MNKKLTIIVPIYNVEKYLDECLNSFLQQTCHDFCVLLIDDGSTDSSPIIAKRFEKQNPELFKYHRQENKGLGGARNTGLGFVQTEYLMFFDSDDFMANRAIENILKQIEKNSTDIIFFNPVIYDEVLQSYKSWHDSELIKSLFTNKEIANPSMNPKFMLTEASVCRAVWRTQFLKDINLKFIEHIHWEDVPPHFLIMHNANTASFMDYEGAYFYRANRGNQITSDNGKSRLDMEYIFDAIKPHFKDGNWSKKEKSFMIGFLSGYIVWTMSMIDSEYLKEFVLFTHDFLQKIKSFGLFTKFYFRCPVGIKNKLLIYMLKNNILYRKLLDKDYIRSKLNILKKLKRIISK